MNRRKFLANTAAAGAALSQTVALNPQEWTIGDIQKRFADGRLTAEALTRLYLRRIAETNLRGPALRAVLEVNPEALKIARELDLERSRKGTRSPLHGVPVLLKDNIDTGDRMQTTAGSLALVGTPARQDAFLVKRLRDAGAVILGKTNLSEWANFRGEHSTSGWSARGGQTRNPYALDRNPCGSSSGSGVAVSAGLCALAVGTETDGSIVCPSSMNGIVGIKPTVGLVSRSGIIPISSSQDTAGPMARTVKDAAILLSWMAGVDPADGATQESAGKTAPDYAQFCKADGLRGARLGVLRSYMDHTYGVEKIVDASLDALRRAGAELVDDIELPSFAKVGDAELAVMQYEFKAGLNAYLAQRGGPVRSLADCIAFNKTHAAEELKYFGQELMEQSQEKESLEDKAYHDAVAECRRMRKEGIDAALSKHKIDALVTTTAGPAGLTDLIGGDHIESTTSSPAAIAGYPHITVPAGHLWGMPVGFSFFASAWSEGKLIRLAYGFEQATQARKAPGFLSTADLRI